MLVTFSTNSMDNGELHYENYEISNYSEFVEKYKEFENYTDSNRVNADGEDFFTRVDMVSGSKELFNEWKELADKEVF